MLKVVLKLFCIDFQVFLGGRGEGFLQSFLGIFECVSRVLHEASCGFSKGSYRIDLSSFFFFPGFLRFFSGFPKRSEEADHPKAFCKNPMHPPKNISGTGKQIIAKETPSSTLQQMFSGCFYALKTYRKNLLEGLGI